jgi:hypothetical protein
MTVSEADIKNNQKRTCSSIIRAGAVHGHGLHLVPSQDALQPSCRKYPHGAPEHIEQHEGWRHEFSRMHQRDILLLYAASLAQHALNTNENESSIFHVHFHPPLATLNAPLLYMWLRMVLPVAALQERHPRPCEMLHSPGKASSLQKAARGLVAWA